MATLLDDLRLIGQEGTRSGWGQEIIRIKCKERIQTYVLDFIYNHPRYHRLILYGGTCLRRCFQINRMSEDIDCETPEPFSKELLANDLREYFHRRIGYQELKVSTPGRSINRVELRFPVLSALGLSPHGAGNLNVKVEINPTDKRYPTEPTAISEDRFSFVITRYDLPTLMAGKMVACLERIWERGKSGVTVKGRDYYDLIWYLHKGVLPNRERLADAPGRYTIEDAFEKLSLMVPRIGRRSLSDDLLPLFEDGRFIERWISSFREGFVNLRQRYATAPYERCCSAACSFDFETDVYRLRISCRNAVGRAVHVLFSFSKEWCDDVAPGVRPSPLDRGHDVDVVVEGEQRRVLEVLAAHGISKTVAYLETVGWKNVIPSTYPAKTVLTPSRMPREGEELSLTADAFERVALEELLARKIFLE